MCDILPPNLTPSQEDVVLQGISLLKHFKMIGIRGDVYSGKHLVAQEIFKRLQATIVNFDICDIARLTTSSLTSQHLIDYLDSLLERVQKYVPPVGIDVSSRVFQPKRSRLGIEDDISELTLEPPAPKLGIIYIRRYNQVSDVVSDCQAKLRYLWPVVIKSFLEKLPDNVRVVATMYSCGLPEILHWCIELNTTPHDMKWVLNYYQDQNLITSEDQEKILNLSKILSIGRILFCLKYALASKTQYEDLIDCYKVALTTFSGSTLNVEKDVPKPDIDHDLIGVESIIDALTTSIIVPMNLGIPGVSIKKGLLLCGPPGTGKSSLGRWLAHQIKGKFYLLGGEVGTCGPHFLDAFEENIRLARANAPAVVFIDDCDTLFDHSDTYRAFLTILDGIDTNKRNDVCVIITCMNVRNVPASLIRGGRLEMVLITKLPDQKHIQMILYRSLNRMKDTLESYNPDIVLSINSDLIKHLAIKMSRWNCADIHRCVNDVTRLIVAGKGTNLVELFEASIREIEYQYTLCGKCESTVPDLKISYIT